MTGKIKEKEKEGLKPVMVVLSDWTKEWSPRVVLIRIP